MKKATARKKNPIRLFLPTNNASHKLQILFILPQLFLHVLPIRLSHIIRLLQSNRVLLFIPFPHSHLNRLLRSLNLVAFPAIRHQEIQGSRHFLPRFSQHFLVSLFHFIHDVDERIRGTRSQQAFQIVPGSVVVRGFLQYVHYKLQLNVDFLLGFLLIILTKAIQTDSWVNT